MKRVFTKMSYLTLSVFLLSLQMKAQAGTDYTYLLKNPSFEHYLDGTAIDVTDPNDANLVSGALRGCPPGWYDNGSIDLTVNNSYGINRDGKNKVGYNLCWASPTPFPEEYELYQELTVGDGDDELPPGEYVISCRMTSYTVRLTNQRLFAQTWNDETVTQTIVQYIADEASYDQNLTEGEIITYAGWGLGSSVTGGETFLKHMSVTITVAAGDVLRLGVKSGNWRADGQRLNTQEGFFKVDDFQIRRAGIVQDTNDYTDRIVNPSFELDRTGTPSKEHNLVYRCAETIDEEYTLTPPYGWSHVIEPQFVGTSYGVNADGNNMDGARCLWAQCTPFSEYFEIYQDISGLPAGKYQVSSKVWTGDQSVTTQRLFAKTPAQNKVQYLATEYDYEYNLTDGEEATFAWVGGTTNDYKNGLQLSDLSVEIDVAAGETLRIGFKTSNQTADGIRQTGSQGWFKLDDFRLWLLESGQGLPTVSKDAPFIVKNQKGGFVLGLQDVITAQLCVLSLSGQKVYSRTVTGETSIELPHGVYIVKVSANGFNQAVKVLVK
jgi:hypothetical protein